MKKFVFVILSIFACSVILISVGATVSAEEPATLPDDTAVTTTTTAASSNEPTTPATISATESTTVAPLTAPTTGKQDNSETTTAAEQPTSSSEQPTAPDEQPTTAPEQPATEPDKPTLPKIYGDADGDGMINAKDVLLLRKYMAGYNIEINTELMDVNLDGAINAKDVLLIRKFMAGYNIILGDKNPERYNFKINAEFVDYTKTSVTLGWTVRGDYHFVKIVDSKGNLIAEVSNAQSQYTVEGLEPNTKYDFTIAAGALIGDKIYTNSVKISAITMLDSVKTSVVGKSASEVSISWENSIYENVELFYSLHGENDYTYFDTVPASRSFALISGLTPGTRYDVKLRGTYIFDGKIIYSEFSQPHYGTTKPGNLSGLKSTRVTASSVDLSWNEAKSADKYQIYYSTTKNGNLKKAGETESLEFTVGGLKYSSEYYIHVRSYKNITGTDYYGAFSVIHVKTADNYITYKYGTSYQGRDLTAYIFNPNAAKTIFIDFAVHGFEDDYYRDGKVLVECGNNIVKYYNDHLSELNGRRLVVVPCANPDGTYAGTNNQRACKTAFGRCTANHVDINRDFYSGGFKAKESQALRDLMKKYKPTYYVNFHGWLDETIGDAKLGSLFRSNLGLTDNRDGKYGSGEGYIIAWARDTFNAKACLVEFKNPNSVNYKNVAKCISKIATW